MKIHSLKIKLTLIMAGTVAAVITIVCILNLTLFNSYYMNNRMKELESSYNDIYTMLTGTDYNTSDIKRKMQDISAVHNINVFVIDSNWTTAYSTQNSENDSIRWLQDFMFGNNKSIEVIKETNKYTIQKGEDPNTGHNYLVAYGVLEDGSQIVMQITIESIHENVLVFNRFVQIVGIFVILISTVAVYFVAASFTRPVKDLSKIAEEMSIMNFDAKYKRNDKSELGLLGNSMNIMSDKLKEKISELKTANIELKKDIEIKTHNDEMRNEFLSNVSHELKTPIALIQGYAEGLKEEINDDAENREFYCEVIMDEASKMNNMVKKLLTLNQIEFGNDPINIERFSIGAIARSVLKSMNIKFKQDNIKILTDIDDSVCVWADQLQMEEVITNYLSNALNHCEGDKVISIKIENTGDGAKLSAYNTGKNIPEEDIDRIWEKFYKVDKARTREYGGNGIGLSIVKAILDNYRADYGAINETDGVTFWCFMPFDK